VNLSPAEIAALEAALPSMGAEEKLALLQQLEAAETAADLAGARGDLLKFAHRVYPNFSVGSHHRVMARLFKDVVEGRKNRIIINMPPRHSKSETTSYLLPAWFFGHKPDAKVIMATHTQSLSEDFGRRVRNLIADPDYQEIFPETSLQTDSKSAGVWGTKQGGRYYAVGVGGALAGRGADLLIIDDAHSEQDIKTGTRLAFDMAWNWYQTGPRQRLQWGGAVIVCMCMTGDTPVLMAGGAEKPLRDIRPGDTVATYENGAVTTAKVVNWRSSGVDDILTVQTRSGRILRANERHPFLVDFDGERRWVRLRNLKPGMSLVATRDAAAQHDRRLDPGFVRRAKQRSRTIRSTLTHCITQWVTTASGRAWDVLNAGSLSQAKGYAQVATTNSTHTQNKHQNNGVRTALSYGMASRQSATMRWLQNAATDAMSAVNCLLPRTPALIGAGNCASITATTRVGSGGCSATTATSQWGTAKAPKSSFSPLSTYDVTLDAIVSIAPTGKEEVFDVEIERTENFIANGFVSHNTRWATYDLTARLLDYAAKNPDADQWEVVEFPAILPSGKSLWPEKWPLEELLKTKASLDSKYWSAQYMQNPSSDEAAIIGRTEWRVWEKDKPPKCTYLIQCLDAAAETNNRSDYTSITTWGVFQNDSEREEHQIILLDRINERMQFPELKAKSIEQFKRWEPDAFIVEKKSSGSALYQELRFMGLPVQEYTPHRGSGDKVARLNAVADIVRTGKVWIPDTWWARELIDQVAQFPNGAHDDDVDTTSMALMRFRQGGYLTLETDDTLTDKSQFYGRRAAYY